MNVVVLMGRLTADPENRQTPQGLSVSTFTVAVDRGYAKQGEERQADFIRCVAWRQNADFISKWFRKGQMIAVEGNIRTRTYDDKDGKRQYITEVHVNQAHFAGSKDGNNGGNTGYNNNAGYSAPSQQAPVTSQPATYSNGNADDFAIVTDNDDLPF